MGPGTQTLPVTGQSELTLYVQQIISAGEVFFLTSTSPQVLASTTTLVPCKLGPMGH
jgi:hypothetical protein